MDYKKIFEQRKSEILEDINIPIRRHLIFLSDFTRVYANAALGTFDFQVQELGGIEFISQIIIHTQSKEEFKVLLIDYLKEHIFFIKRFEKTIIIPAPGPEQANQLKFDF